MSLALINNYHCMTEAFLQDFFDIMEEEITAAMPSSSSSSNLRDANDSKVSYLSSVERNITNPFRFADIVCQIMISVSG
ncbi:GTPase Der [Dirofilaria immitis]